MHRQMRYFIAVVETNSFFEAGEVCHLHFAMSKDGKSVDPTAYLP